MLQFNDQRWTVGECSLDVAFPLHSQNLPEAWWSLDVSARQPGHTHTQDDLRVCLQPIFAPMRDWRELQNIEINVNADWQDAHEFVNEDGEVQWSELEARWWPDRSINKAHYWISDQFLLRLGSWERGRFICELESLLQTEETYYRDPPSSNSHTSVCGQPVSLLLMDQVQIRKCEIDVPGDVRDPLGWAEGKAARMLGFRSFRSSHIYRGDNAMRSWKVTLVPDISE